MNKVIAPLLVLVGLVITLTGCKQSPQASQSTGPDNAATRYGQNLADSPGKAQTSANQANELIQQQEKALQGADLQTQQQPQ